MNNTEKGVDVKTDVLTPELVAKFKKIDIKSFGRHTKEERKKFLQNTYIPMFERGEFNDFECWAVAGYQFYLMGYSLDDFILITKDDTVWKSQAEALWGDYENIIKKDMEIKKKINEIVTTLCIEDFDKFLKKIMLEGKQYILNLTTDTFMKLKDAREHFTEEKWYVDIYNDSIKKKNESERVNGFELWFNNPAYSYQKMIFDAELPYGHNEINGLYYWNQYKHPDLKDGEGTYDLFLEHIKENICNNNDEVYQFVLKWIFHLIKYPNAKNGIVLAIKGLQGTGKSTIFEILQMFFANGYAKTINTSEEIMNKFNSSWATCYLISLEEAVFAGTKRNGVWGKLKDLITNKSITMERKGIEPMVLDNHLHIMITTNNEWAAPKEIGDRRYLVLKANENRLQDWDYFAEMREDMENGGLKKLYEMAMKDTSIQRNMRWKLPETEESFEDILLSASPVLQMWVRLTEDYENNEDYIRELFVVSNKGKLCVKPASLYEYYSKNSFGVDRGRKETSNLFDDHKKRMSINNKKDTFYVFDDVDDLKQTIIKNGFRGTNVFNMNNNDCDDDISTIEDVVNVLHFRKANSV